MQYIQYIHNQQHTNTHTPTIHTYHSRHTQIHKSTHTPTAQAHAEATQGFAFQWQPLESPLWTPGAGSCLGFLLLSTAYSRHSSFEPWQSNHFISSLPQTREECDLLFLNFKKWNRYEICFLDTFVSSCSEHAVEWSGFWLNWPMTTGPDVGSSGFLLTYQRQF